MPFRFKCRECKEFIYIEELRKWQANYPCPNCNAHNFMTPKQAILNFNIEEIDEHIDCPSCNKPQNRNAIFCKDCGTEISPKELVTIAYCEKCESEYDESYQFCENDGNQLVLREKEIDTAIQDVISQTAFIGSDNNPFIVAFEKEFASYLGVKNCVSCANGTDALEISLNAFGIGEGDEVIVPAIS